MSSTEHPEDIYARDSERACPQCGGSGHKDDAQPSQAAADVLAERRRQIEQEGWTPEHDAKHSKGELLLAAKAYFMNATGRAILRPSGDRVGTPFEWPWTADWWKPKDQRRDLVRAGALALAEIARIDRLYAKRASSRYVDAEAYYTLIIAEIERIDRAAEREADHA